MDCHLALLAGGRLLPLAELLRENDVVADLLSDWLLNLIALQLNELVLDDIVLLQFVPVLFSFIE